MHSRRLTLTIFCLAAGITLASYGPTLAQSGDPANELTLSPYWSYAVSRWEPIILQEAQRRNLDPDFIAALIWKESAGRSTVSGPAGAVGLMMVMPFPWRPSPEELMDPWVNVFWGARALANTIEDGDGDLYYSLAAYNGSWAQIHLRVTRRYAASILDEYTRAVAVRYGLPKDGEWLALLAEEGTPGPKTIIALGPQRPLTRYTERPLGQADIPMIPLDLPPHATAFTFVGEQGVQRRINVWLLAEDNSSYVPFAVQPIFSPLYAGYGRNGERHSTSSFSPPAEPTVPAFRSPTPTPTLTSTPTPIPTPEFDAIVLAGGADLRPGSSAWWDPLLTLPAGTELELSGYDPDFPGWVYVTAPNRASTGWVQIADLEINRELSSLPRVTPIPTLISTSAAPTPTPTQPAPTPTFAPTPSLTPTTVLTQTPSAGCESGPLWLAAWPLEKVNTEDGWKVTIFVQGHGGGCLYTYSWEGQVVSEPISSSLTFEVSQIDPHAVIFGTASVASAGEIDEVGLYIKPPGED